MFRISCSSSLHIGYDEPEILRYENLKAVPQALTLGTKYLNNMVEQDHRFIKRITRPMLGFKAFHSAAATLAGIETAHMIHKGQFGQTGVSQFTQFAALAA